MNTNQFAEFSTCGQPEAVLQVAEGALPQTQEGEILVRMKAAPINPADINFVQGVYGLKPQLPHSAAGLEGFGVVEQSKSPNFAVGDQVIMLKGMGSWCRYLCAPAENFMKIEVAVDAMQAAMLKVNPLTAWLALTQYVDLKPGDWVVQNAANSGVGRCFIQLCREMGVRTVNFVRKADELREELMALGADIVVGEDEENVVKNTLALMEGARPVLASNCVGGESALRLMDMLAPSACMVTFGAMSKKSIKVPNGWLIFKNLSLRGLWCTEWLKSASPEQVQGAYNYLATLMSEGKLTQAIDCTYSLAQVQEACAHAQQEYRAGKIVLEL